MIIILNTHILFIRKVKCQCGTEIFFSDTVMISIANLYARGKERIKLLSTFIEIVFLLFFFF